MVGYANPHREFCLISMILKNAIFVCVYFDSIGRVDRDGELLHKKAWVEMISWEP